MKVYGIEYKSPEPDNHYAVTLSDGGYFTVDAHNLDDANAQAQWHLFHPDNPRPLPNIVEVKYLWKNI